MNYNLGYDLGYYHRGHTVLTINKIIARLLNQYRARNDQNEVEGVRKTVGPGK